MSLRERGGLGTKREKPPIRKRASQILWFVGLWLAGLATVGTIAFIIRSVLL